MPPTHPEAPLTAAQERAVRALLASARHDEGVPDDVAARLDAQLAELTAVRRELRPRGGHVEGSVGGPVVSLAARRRRRVATGLVAAAAVVAIGTGVAQVVPGPLSSGDSAVSGGSAGGSPDGESGAGAGGEPDAGTDLGTDSGARRRSTAQQERAATADKAGSAIPRLAPDRFVRDVRRVRDRQLLDTALGDYRTQAGRLDAGGACDSGLSGPGRRVLVDYAGTPAVLVLSRPDGEVQAVSLVACGSGEVLRRLELPAP